MQAEEKVVCFNCETAEHVTTTVEKHAIEYGTQGTKVEAAFPVHHCSNCDESFLSHAGMEARDAAVRAHEAASRT
jgi:YgiT-type zinc finger domain-containing protein